MNTSYTSWINWCFLNTYPHSSAWISRRKLFRPLFHGHNMWSLAKACICGGGLSGIGIPLDARHITGAQGKDNAKVFSPLLAHALPPNTRAKCSKRNVAIKLTYHSPQPPIKHPLWQHLRALKGSFVVYLFLEFCRSKWRTLVSCLA